MAADDRAAEGVLYQFDFPKDEAASGSRVSCLREPMFPQGNLSGMDEEV